VTLAFTKLVARSFDLDHLDLFWETNNFQGNVLEWDLFVLRSESPGGPFEQLAGPFQDQYQFRDVSPALLHKWRNLYYKIRAVNRTTQAVVESGVTSQLPEPNLEALEMQRLEEVVWRNFAGRKCWLFPVRTFGPLCICVDPVGGRRTRSNCITCYDVGFLGGYLTPIECYVQIDSFTKKPDLTTLGEKHPVNTSARLISFPPVKPKDVLVEAENIRWRVVVVNNTERLRATVHQELTLHQISPGDIEYKLPVKIADLRALVAQDERNFTNKQHANHDEALANILAVYGGMRGGI
jgi:hypothetical protein